jgi:peptidoglycan/LPS O-acetylase OafA/YrhL
LSPLSRSQAVVRWLAGRAIAPGDLSHAGNGFTALRWILAATVMISHAWDITQFGRGLDPTVAVLSFPISRLAVFLFFTLSGFLVTGSLFKRGFGAFLWARVLRLVPGLWVMLLVVPLLLWAGFSTLRFGAFFGDPETWRFIGRNALLLGRAYTLPDLFPQHPLGNSVNGSLWTIPHEVRCYLVLAGGAALGLTVPRRRFTVLIGIGLAGLLLLPPLVEPFESSRRLGFSFFIGVLAWLWRDRLRLSWPVGLAGAGLALALPGDMALKVPAMQLGCGYLMLVIAFAVPVALKTASARLPDYSYGIYIYAFPAQQAALALDASDPLANIALGLVFTLPLAALSWHLVEKPALAAKIGKRVPGPANLSG